MSDEQKSETGGPPPPAPAVPREYLPPRLRDRLYGSEDEPPPASDNPLLGWIAMLIIAAMIAGLVYWKMQSTKAEKRAAAAQAAAEHAAAVKDSLARLATLDSLRAVHSADSLAAFLKLPAWKQAQLKSGAAKDDTSAAAKAAEEPGHFVIDAGTFLFEDPANQAATTIKGKTKLDVKVVPVQNDGSTQFHVYVGNYKVRGEATLEANRLFESGKLEQANVVKLDSP